ncbi:Taurine transport system permease protein TauC [Chlamydiales bacterium SCGC AG-110-P3]|nr:Taurine transport system permease protein TauC [Chlamydiales bacterium SCGC AG-110-P3]
MLKRSSRVSPLSVAAAAAVLTVLWQGLSILLDSIALPPPMAVFRHFTTDIAIQISTHLGISLYRVTVSLTLGVATAAPLGMLVGRSKRIDGACAPLIYLLYPIPKIVLLPVFLMILGIGDLSKILLITMIVFFQILVATRDAARAINPALIVSMRSLGAGRWDLFRHVVVPGCLPKVFSCLRVSLGTAIAVLFLTETYATTHGIGFYIMDALSRFDYVDVFAGVLIMSAMGFLLFSLLDLIEHRACRWQHI